MNEISRMQRVKETECNAKANSTYPNQFSEKYIHLNNEQSTNKKHN